MMHRVTSHWRWMSVAALAALLLVVGCNDGDAALKAALDPALADGSLARLAAAPAGEPLVFSIRHGGEPEPDISEHPASSLAYLPGMALLKADPADAQALCEAAAPRTVVIWGAGTDVAKLDPTLRRDLLQSMTVPDGHTRPLDVIATFDPASDPTADLQNAGATIGSYAAGIATMRVTGETLLDLLAHDDLREVAKPSLQQPAQGDR